MGFRCFSQVCFGCIGVCEWWYNWLLLKERRLRHVGSCRGEVIWDITKGYFSFEKVGDYFLIRVISLHPYNSEFCISNIIYIWISIVGCGMSGRTLAWWHLDWVLVCFVMLILLNTFGVIRLEAFGNVKKHVTRTVSIGSSWNRPKCLMVIIYMHECKYGKITSAHLYIFYVYLYMHAWMSDIHLTFNLGDITWGLWKC